MRWDHHRAEENWNGDGTLTGLMAIGFRPRRCKCGLVNSRSVIESWVEDGGKREKGDFYSWAKWKVGGKEVESGLENSEVTNTKTWDKKRIRARV